MKSYQSDLNEKNWRKKIIKDGPTGTYIFPNWVNWGVGVRSKLIIFIGTLDTYFLSSFIDIHKQFQSRSWICYFKQVTFSLLFAVLKINKNLYKKNILTEALLKKKIQLRHMKFMHNDRPQGCNYIKYSYI